MVARTMFETWDDLLANQTIDGGKVCATQFGFHPRPNPTSKLTIKKQVFCWLIVVATIRTHWNKCYTSFLQVFIRWELVMESPLEDNSFRGRGIKLFLISLTQLTSFYLGNKTWWESFKQSSHLREPPNNAIFPIRGHWNNDASNGIHYV